MDDKIENNIFKIGNSLISTKQCLIINNEINNNNNLNNGLIESRSECESEESFNENISKFDKYIYTFLLCYANLTYGISLTCLAPALLDFTCILNIEAELASHYYTLFAIGTIIGSCFGFLFKYVNRQFVLMLALLLYGLVTAFLPISPDFPVFYLFGLIGGMGAGTLDIVQTVWLIEMWVHKSGSILQLSEFSFGVGLIIGPLVVEPFVFSYENCTGPFLNETDYDSSYYGNKLMVPFMISGALQVLGAVMLALMFFTHKYVPDSKEGEKDVIEKEIEEVLRPIEKLYQRRYTVQIVEEKSDSRSSSLKSKHSSLKLPRYSIQVMGKRKSDEFDRQKNSANYYSYPIRRRYSSFQRLDIVPSLPTKMPRKTTIGLGAVCFATAIVSEAAFIDFSPTFFRYYCDFHPSKTAILLSVMTASYTLTRAISIFVAIRVRPEYILCFHYAVTYCGIISLFFSQDNQVVAWTGNILFGIGIATFWSATFSHIENYYEITDRIGTIYVSTLGLLEIATQFIEGPFLEKHPEVLLYYCFATITVSFISFIMIRVIVFRFNANSGHTSLMNSKNSSHVFNDDMVTKI